MQLPDFSLIIKIDCTLQVFKGVKVRRTESEEESADVLNKFYQDVPGRMTASKRVVLEDTRRKGNSFQFRQDGS